MKSKARIRFLIMAVMLLLMMTALVLQLGNLTIVHGEEYATEAENRRTTTMYTTGARGRILDRNGIPLAYDETSYNVQFYRDPERLSDDDSALYTESLISAINIIEAGGGTTIDTFYIKKDPNTGDLYYDWGVDSPKSQEARYKNFCNVMGAKFYMRDPADTSTWIPADEAYKLLRNSWQIPAELTFEEARKVMSVRQEINMNKWRAYEPITIAYNVSIEVVAQLDMLSEDLLGIKTQKSTTRVYPRGSTASHILGYLSRQVKDDISPDALLYMGYTEEDLQWYENAYSKDENGDLKTDSDGNPYSIYGTNEDGEKILRMTRMGYSPNDYTGVAGVEKTMEAYLTASTDKQHGVQTIEINKHGTITRTLETTAASDGNDVMLTIDLPLQEVTEAALEKAITNIREKEEEKLRESAEDYLDQRSDLNSIKMAETGSIVVLDAHTGATLALASYPDFDPNMFIAGLTPEQAAELFGKEGDDTPTLTPTLNRAISSRLAPGSIFKMCTGLAGLMEHEVTLTETIKDESPYTKYESGDEVIQNAPWCWNHKHVHNENITGALTKSCNYYFYKVADRLGIQRLDDWATKLGLSDLTGIELPGELESHVGGQKVLYNNEVSLSQQKSSLPGYVYRQVRKQLVRVLDYSQKEVDDETIDRCAERILELQTGESTELGAGIRRILREELGVAEGLSRGQTWVSDIASMLTELQWKPTLTVRAGIGQATTLTTPVAIARYAAAFANGGTVYNVRVVDKIIGGDGSVVKENAPTVFSQIDAPQEYWNAILSGLAGVVSPEDGGTAEKAFTQEFRDQGYLEQIIGKSGTAQISVSNSVDIENTSWFVTMLPAEAPEIVIVTCIPYGLSGSTGGAPAVEEITRFYLDRKAGTVADNLVSPDGFIP
ncbi:MAG: penicillin-binding transpeptidase domain-containing protein [Eubacteriales bacterium]|nr:penicillin-binding transpeptidase domain-containing protein [Eubacteriales bacterium]